MTEEFVDRLPHLPGDVMAAGRVVRRAGYTIVKRDALDELRAELERLRELTATCTCYDGNPANYEGAHADCPVHGAVRAYNEAQAVIERTRSAARRLAEHYDDPHGTTETGQMIGDLLAALTAGRTP